MRRLARRLAAHAQLEFARRSAGGCAVVLVYHAVGPVAGNPHRDLVPTLAANRFREQLDHLARRFDVVPVTELRSCLLARSHGARLPVALTFDDDLSGHLRHVAPALAERGMPATFYLTGRTLDGPDPFWWQDLQALADRGPGGLDDVRDGLAENWPWARGGGDLHDLGRTIEGLPPAQRDAVTEELRGLAGDIVPEPGLSSAAVGELVAGGFDIGFHTRRHDPLPSLGDEELADAMLDGRDRLQALSARPLSSIAYPHGRADLRVAHAAAQAGYATGLTWTGQAVDAARPPLLFDRADAWAPSADTFAWRLARVVTRGARAAAEARSSR